MTVAGTREGAMSSSAKAPGLVEPLKPGIRRCTTRGSRQWGPCPRGPVAAYGLVPRVSNQGFVGPAVVVERLARPWDRYHDRGVDRGSVVVTHGSFAVGATLWGRRDSSTCCKSHWKTRLLASRSLSDMRTQTLLGASEGDHRCALPLSATRCSTSVPYLSQGARDFMPQCS